MIIQTILKDETGGVVIEKFIRLKPKMYSFLEDNSVHKKAKSVEALNKALNNKTLNEQNSK